MLIEHVPAATNTVNCRRTAGLGVCVISYIQYVVRGKQVIIVPQDFMLLTLDLIFIA
jgi:hypothetical protein